MHRLNRSMTCGILIPQSGIEPASPALKGRFVTSRATREAQLKDMIVNGIIAYNYSVAPNLALVIYYSQGSVQFSSVAQSCSTLCDPMNRSMPGLPVPLVHYLPELVQTHVH